ncbi:methylmalonyl-CoA decarboxylase [Fluviibacter phosphoraccumulans]|uniref:methylmalonyl-CoA decarboxylase n=1 Tax=Fluviibacter phosphoraccumulans TaxID=1751046 RepID=UPI0010BA24CB|nr:methylmalonyl-CoA decarboxylase [Fluviibacter phosphoraccumulans]BCA64926.1 methylmalonyl-CoA decarboxylase [Fluviibacter phosphoraccumulans]
MKLIETSQAEHIGILTLNNTDRLNVMGNDLVNQLIESLEFFATTGMRAVILKTLPGVKVWSAGYDVNELPPHGRDPLECHEPLRRAVKAMQTCPLPIIVVVEGSVWGGANELVMSGDMVVAAKGTSFALTPSRLGVPYNPSGIMTFMNSMPLHILKEMVCRAVPVKAERLQTYGVVNHVVPADELESFSIQIAKEICLTSPLANSVFKAQITSMMSAIPLTSNEFEQIEASRRVVYSSDDYREGVSAIKEKRAPVFQGR